MRKARIGKGIGILFFLVLVHGLVFCLATSARATAFDLIISYNAGTERLQLKNSVGEKFTEVPAKIGYSGTLCSYPSEIMLIKACNFGAGYPYDALVFFGSQGQTLAAFYLTPGDGEKVAKWFVNKVSDKTEVGVRDLKVILQ